VTTRRVNAVSPWSQHGQETPSTAVIYLRVSTKEQATRGGEAEGFSIPAQREACRRKAAALGAVVVEEFVDRGESARSARRPELQRMLAYIADNPVGFCIVHKVDRLARNRVDDVEINVALTQSGVTLVSCSENIDETPSGILLHGIMSSIAEFYSRNLAAEVNKGLIQKAKNGGTPFRAPLGYRPVRLFDEGRETRSVEIDPERASIVKQAFEMYATGEWTTRTLLVELTEKGLLSRPTPKRPARPVTTSGFHSMLRNPYYIGVIEYRGVRSQGKHEPLIAQPIFDEVQRRLESQNLAGEKRRVHHHYLKGSIWCGCCESRLIVCNAKSRSGTIYPYFICIGRQRDAASCTQRALSIDHVERAIEDYYAKVELSRDLRLQTEQTILEQIAGLRETDIVDRQRIVTRQRRLLDERAKLLEAHYAGAIPLDLLKTEQDRISSELDNIEQRLSATELKSDTIEINLKKALDLVGSLHAAYIDAPPRTRRLMNQAIFERFLINETEEVTGTLAGPFDLLLEASRPQGDESRKASETPRGPENGPRGLSIESLVELSGLEPEARARYRTADER
jgi:site-specific DNA recombinase